MTAEEQDRMIHSLAVPFDAAEIKFKAQTVSGNRALAVPYVDARVIQDRLDDVLGLLNWQDSYECLPDGSVVCRLKIRLGDEWITKEDVGGQSEQPDEGDRRKAAFSDALKRAAVKFGIGRYLYRQKPQWVDWDAQKRQFARQPALPVPPTQTQASARSPSARSPSAPPTAPGQKADTSRPASDEARREIQAHLDRTGETIERVWAKLGVPKGTRLSAEQAQVVLDRLAKLPDAPQATKTQKAGVA